MIKNHRNFQVEKPTKSASIEFLGERVTVMVSCADNVVHVEITESDRNGDWYASRELIYETDPDLDGEPEGYFDPEE